MYEVLYENHVLIGFASDLPRELNYRPIRNTMSNRTEWSMSRFVTFNREQRAF